MKESALTSLCTALMALYQIDNFYIKTSKNIIGFSKNDLPSPINKFIGSSKNILSAFKTNLLDPLEEILVHLIILIK